MRVCLSGRIWLTILRIWGSNPMSSMRSASSRTYSRRVGGGGGWGILICCSPQSFGHWPRIPFETEGGGGRDYVKNKKWEQAVTGLPAARRRNQVEHVFFQSRPRRPLFRTCPSNVYRFQVCVCPRARTRRRGKNKKQHRLVEPYKITRYFETPRIHLKNSKVWLPYATGARPPSRTTVVPNCCRIPGTN